MTIQRVELFHVELPLKKKVRHASHERSSSDSLIVRVTLAGGVEGYGEGVPRPYVTGETIESTFSTLNGCDIAAHIGRPNSFRDVVRVAGNPCRAGECGRPARNGGQRRWCALELAVLDAYGHQYGESLGIAVRLADVPGLSLTPLMPCAR